MSTKTVGGVKFVKIPTGQWKIDGTRFTVMRPSDPRVVGVVKDGKYTRLTNEDVADALAEGYKVPLRMQIYSE